MIKRRLICSSGEVFLSEEAIGATAESCDQFPVVVSCPGGGKQINDALTAAGFELKDHGLLGRIMETDLEYEIAHSVLVQNANDLWRVHMERRILANVAMPELRMTFMKPVVIAGSPQIESTEVSALVNKDQYVLSWYYGYASIYVFTPRDRVEKKQNFFKPYDHDHKIKVIGV